MMVKIFRRMASVSFETARAVVQNARSRTQPEMIARLKEIGFDGKRSLASFTKKEQEEILILLPQTTSYLLELLEVVPRE